MRFCVYITVGFVSLALGNLSLWENSGLLPRKPFVSDRADVRGNDAPPDSCFGEALQRRIDRATRNEPVLVRPGTHDLCGRTLSVPSEKTVQGRRGAALSNGKIRISGTLGKRIDLARKVEQGSRKLVLEAGSGTGLHPGDWVAVAESRSLNNNDQPDKGIPQELVQVASLDSTERAVTVYLRHTLHHTYELSGTDYESGVYKTAPIVGSSVRDLALEKVDVELGIAQSVTLANLRLDRAHITPAKSSIATIADARFRDVRIYHPRHSRSWNVLLELHGCSRCVLEQISTFGGKKDGLRLNGIADTVLRKIRIQRAPVRSLRIYHGDKVRIDEVTILEGGYNRGESANIEQLLLDYTNDVEAQDIKILRFFQQDAVELRGNSGDLRIRDLLVVEHPEPVNDANTCTHVHGGNFRVEDVSINGFHFDGCSQQLRLAEGMSNVRIVNGSFVDARGVSVDGGRNLVRDMEHVSFRNLEIAREKTGVIIRNRNQTAHNIRSVRLENVHVYGGCEDDGSLLNISDVKGLDIVNSYFEAVGSRRVLVRGGTRRVRYINNIDQGVREVIIHGGVDVESQARRVVRN